MRANLTSMLDGRRHHELHRRSALSARL